MTVRLSGPPQGWNAAALDAESLRATAQALLAALQQSDAEVSVALVDDPAMADLNELHRGRPGPTDVLSFSMLEGEFAEHRGTLLGDVVIDVDAAARQADELGHSFMHELRRLLIHGVLHLLGHDHERPEEARVMESLERRLARELGP